MNGNAIVTMIHPGGVPGGDIRFAVMAAILNRSIEVHSPETPLIVIVAGDWDEANLLPISSGSCHLLRKSLFQGKTGAPYWRGNMSKVHAWNLLQFDKVLFVDADCWLQSSPAECFELPAFTCCPGPEAPMNAARMILKPKRETFYNLLAIMDEYKFSPVDGWNSFGRFEWPKYDSSPRPGELSAWDFNAADSDQGLFWYYFGLVNQSLTYAGSGKLAAAVGHLGSGERKFSKLPASYKTLVDELNFEEFFGA